MRRLLGIALAPGFIYVFVDRWTGLIPQAISPGKEGKKGSQILINIPERDR
jgi:hypothetical protein